MKIHIQIKPNASKDELVQLENQLVAKISAPPIDGKANKRLIRFLSKELKIRTSDIKLLKGESSRFKTLDINITQEDWNKKIATYLS